jgi:small subunit ribosomal protein S1
MKPWVVCRELEEQGIMDEGYWKSLLRDAEGDLDSSTTTAEQECPVNVSEDDMSELAALGTSDKGRRAADGTEPHGRIPGGRDEADWQRAATLLASGEAIKVTISGYNRGGLLAEVGRVQGFLPASHLLAPTPSLAPEARMAALAGRVGDCLTVKVAEIDRDRCRLILSERLAGSEAEGYALLGTLRPGQTCEGTVTNLCAFGIFVDLGGFEGLVHISELSWGRVESAAEVAKPGDHVRVVVLQVSPEEHRVSLSLKRLQPDPWQGVEGRYHIGQTLDAVITNVVTFGAFARLEAGLEGLIHISELAEGSFMHPRNVVKEGDQVRVRVLGVDGSKRRIALTMRNPNTAARTGGGVSPESPQTPALW